MHTENGLKRSDHWLAAWICASVVYLAFSMHLPVSLYATAGHDDALFIRIAQHLVHGDWLGPYSQMALAKGPGYPFFLAANAVLGVPITLSLALLYLLSCGVFARTLAGFGLNKACVFAIFSVLLFQPALFPTRIVRDNIYPSLTLLVVAGLLFVTQHKPLRTVLRQVVLFGWAFGVFWMTREEGVWILPGIGCYVAYRGVLLREDRQGLKQLCMRLLVYFLAAALVPIAVACLNLFAYGKWETVDFTGRSFSTVLSRLNSVSAGPEVPFVPVPHSKRKLIYEVSPAFRQLEPYFEDRGRVWTEPGCAIYKSTCGDYAGGWFMWALRDAVANRGHYSNPHKAAEFYDQISSEIEAACKQGTLQCQKRFLPFLPHIPAENWDLIPVAISKAIQILIYQVPVGLTDLDSLGTAPSLHDMRLFLGNLKTTPSSDEQQNIVLAGWFYSPKNEWPSLDCMRDGQRTLLAIPRARSPDIAAHFDDTNAHSQRFSLSLRRQDDCQFSLGQPGAGPLPVADLIRQEGRESPLGSGKLFLDMRTPAEGSFAKSLQAKQKLVNVYRWLSPILTAVGMACFVGVIGWQLKRRHSPPALLWVVGMLWVHCLVRIALVVLIDVTSFPAVGYLYLMPIFPLVCAASILSIALLAAEVRQATGIENRRTPEQG